MRRSISMIRAGAVGALVVGAAACASDSEPSTATETAAPVTDVAATDAPTDVVSTDPPATEAPPTTDAASPATDAAPTTEPAPTAAPTTPPEPECPEPAPNEATQPAGIVTSLDATAGDYPEGVAVDRSGNVFVSLTEQGQLIKFAPGSSDYELFAEIPNWELAGSGFLGLAVDDLGHVYGASELGVFEFDCRTGEPTLVEGTQAIGFPNSLAFDDQGNLYVTDMFSNGDVDAPLGAIWRINADRSVEKWVEDAALGGTGAFGLPQPSGANGIAVRDGVVYAAVTERSAIRSIPVLDDGTAGDIGTVIEGGASPDGIALDADGRIYLADIVTSRIQRVNADGTLEVLAEGVPAGLDLPASLAFGVGGTELTLYATNLSFDDFSNGVGPALVAIDVDTTGQLPPR